MNKCTKVRTTNILLIPVYEIEGSARLDFFLTKLLSKYPDATIGTLLQKVVRTKVELHLCDGKKVSSSNKERYGWFGVGGCGKGVMEELTRYLEKNGYQLRMQTSRELSRYINDGGPDPNIDPETLKIN